MPLILQKKESKEWIENYPVYGLYIDGKLVSSITFCMPWVKYSTPDKYPHIAHFVTAPAFKGKGLCTGNLRLCRRAFKGTV